MQSVCRSSIPKPPVPAAMASVLRQFLCCSWGGPAILAVVAWCWTVAAIDPAGDYPSASQGPGLTVDEVFNVQQGVLLANSLLDGDLPAYRRACDLLPDHPPLGRLCLGLAHEFWWIVHPPVPSDVPYSITCARVGSATAFALTILLIGTFAGRWYGPLGGLAAAVAVLLQPRVFGHAHLASLESGMNLAYCAAVLAVARWSEASTPPKWRAAAGAGGLLGLAALTKVQAILLPLPVILWAVIVWRRRAAVPLLVWGLTGLLVFYAGWPWLWEHPWTHLQQYLGRTTDRASVYVWYFGKSLADRDVPWHYPWVLFATTVPLGLHLLACGGLVVKATEPQTPGNPPSTRPWLTAAEMLVLVCLVFPLVVFSIPGVAVYDGARLFLMVFPLWAIFVGRGAVVLLDRLSCRWNLRLAGVVVGGVLAGQCVGNLLLAPCYLSYYNALTGGLWGADRLGLQPTYWGDSITRELLGKVAEHVPAGANVQVAPTLHQFQWPELQQQSPILRRRRIRLVSFDSRYSKPGKYLLLFMRWEYLSPEIRQIVARQPPVAAVRRQGVLLAALYDLEGLP